MNGGWTGEILSDGKDAIILSPCLANCFFLHCIHFDRIVLSFNVCLASKNPKCSSYWSHDVINAWMTFNPVGYLNNQFSYLVIFGNIEGCFASYGMSAISKRPSTFINPSYEICCSHWKLLFELAASFLLRHFHNHGWSNFLYVLKVSLMLIVTLLNLCYQYV